MDYLMFTSDEQDSKRKSTQNGKTRSTVIEQYLNIPFNFRSTSVWCEIQEIGTSNWKWNCIEEIINQSLKKFSKIRNIHNDLNGFKKFQDIFRVLLMQKSRMQIPPCNMIDIMYPSVSLSCILVEEKYVMCSWVMKLGFGRESFGHWTRRTDRLNV